jgi:hypothetical protein
MDWLMIGFNSVVGIGIESYSIICSSGNSLLEKY